MKNDIGIGIIDVHSTEMVEKCIKSIPENLKESIFIVSNKLKSNSVYKNFDKQVPFATLRNYLINEMRINDKKYYFILNSNVEIIDLNFFEKTIKLAETFGTWFMTGQGKGKSVSVEDDAANVSLEISPHLNTNVLFLYSGIIKNFGFFEERFFNTKDLDIIDYINRLREKKVYPPKHFNPTIGTGLVLEQEAEIEKINHRDIPKSQTEYKPDGDKSMELSIAYFYHKHKYVPNQNEPAGVTQQELLQFMEELQKNYASTQS